MSSCLVCVQYLACPSISTYVEDFVNKTLEATSGEADGSNGDNHDDAGVVSNIQCFFFFVDLVVLLSGSSPYCVVLSGMVLSRRV